MLKALIVGGDSVSPDIIFGRRELFPTFNWMISQGASASYSAYVQKGYTGSYSSEQNWASIYTGLAPSEHKINTNISRGELRRPEMRDFDGLRPFWQVLNDNGFRVGLWAADNCAVPVPIKGYAISAKYQMIDTPIENREAEREIQLCKKDKSLMCFLDGKPPSRLYPKTLLQQGYTFEQLQRDPQSAEKAISEYHFQDALPNFKSELEYWFGAMRRAQREHPVDVLFFYTPTTDLIAHCCMYCDNNPILLKAYQILDQFIGDFVQEFEPENTVFLSDHGQQNFKDLIQCSNKEIRREAFSARDEVLWLKNGYIAFEAHNGALLFTAHALKGTFIAVGSDIRNTVVKDMRTLDIYPTLLEIFGVCNPKDRSGYVVDIFTRNIQNTEKLLKQNTLKQKSVALVQTHAINITDIILNELYIEKRFAEITVVGEAKYEEIFLGNPRVTAFVPFDKFDARCFDEVYCGIYNKDSGFIRHIRVCGGT